MLKCGLVLKRLEEVAGFESALSQMLLRTPPLRNDAYAQKTVVDVM